MTLQKKSKPFSKTEMKILVYNKMKREGLGYEQACKSVEEEVNVLNKIKDEKRRTDKTSN